MRNLIAVLIVASTLMVSGCGGSGGKRASNPAPSGAVDNPEVPTQNLNGSLSGKIYYDKFGRYHELDIASGLTRLVYDYDFGYWAVSRRDGQEFSVGSNRTNSDNYRNEDVVFFDLNGNETYRRVIYGEVKDTVKISPDGKFFAFNWYRNSDNNGLVVLAREGAWERNFDLANGRGFDWTSDGQLIFSIANEIFKVENVATSEPEKIATLPTESWRYALSLSVSPDDKNIAFWFKSEGDYTGHIFVIGMNGSDLHQVTTSDLWEHSVTWSPDGQHLAVVKGKYMTNVPDGYWSDGGQGNIVPMLYVVKADARNVDISANYPKDATVIRDYQVDGSSFFVTPDSPISWQVGN